MGLDMYLEGETYHYGAPSWEKKSGDLKKTTVHLGYWRKHPDLHGYIVQTFAGGVDECQRIGLSKADLVLLIDAVNDDRLPKTDGFFFGVTDGSEKEETLHTLRAALDWANEYVDNATRTVYYQASW